MLGKMIVQGLVAAAIIGSAAAVYAQAKDDGILTPKPAQATGVAPAARDGGDGYLRPAEARTRQRDERGTAIASDRHRDHHGRGRDHDDDDDE